MITRTDVLRHLNTTLHVDDFDDYCVNGLQVEGCMDVRRVITGVSCSRSLFEQAVAVRADLIVVHHGLFWKGAPHPFYLTGILRDRVKILLEHDINLAGYHLPLDAHPDIGNNAMLLKQLGFPISEPLDIGFISRLDSGLSVDALRSQLDRALPDPCRIYGDLSGNIRTVAMVSGGAAGLLNKVYAAGADAYITGEPSEPSVRAAEEMGICFISIGHYNSERPGPIALAEHIHKTFDLPADFIDIPNPF